MIAIGFLALHPVHLEPVPARSIPAPADGQGLNPLLQDPGLAFHPPFLYLGYVGFSMAFSFADRRADRGPGRRRLGALGAAVDAGGLVRADARHRHGLWWAYYALGWGGWWFWDPVENASFMPWLAGTALLHSAIVVEKRDALKSWTDPARHPHLLAVA